MTEQKPKQTSQIRLEDIRDYFKRHPIQRKLINAAIRPVYLLDPACKNPDSYTGMLKGTIISEKLLYPDQEQPDGVSYHHACPGRWLAYDFHRPEVLGPKKKGPTRQLFGGKLLTYMLEELRGQPGNEESPPFNFFDIVQGLVVYHPGIGQLVEEEYVTPTTHQEAYRQVDAYEEYADAMHSRGVADDRVYQVTPKGNAMIFLVSDGGKQRPNEDKEKNPVFGFLPGTAHGAAAIVNPPLQP
ncbi:MAG TPA: hypothetical protein VF733_03965 [Candidatus Saccharimonadales bacterium]